MHDVLRALDIAASNSGAYCGRWLDTKGAAITPSNPATGKPIATVRAANAADYEQVVSAAQSAFMQWRELPAPKRGEYVRRMGLALREHKDALGKLVTLEMGKIVEEGRGEVQECIDIADFAVGLSRQLYGLTIHSERNDHSMREAWHPLGVVGVITAFNFPAAVWAWNSMLALTCGDACVWKPSHKTPLTAIALTKICARVLEPDGLGGLIGLIIGSDSDISHRLVDDPRVPLISATGSTRMGRAVGQRVAARLGRSLLELGGNNAIVVLEDADLDMAMRAILFGAIGTAGQRCTTTRRLLVAEQVVDALQARLVKAYASVPIGDPLDAKTLMGPLIDQAAIEAFDHAIAQAKREGGQVVAGGGRPKMHGDLAGGAFVQPTIIRMPDQTAVVREETFAPILYVIPVKDYAHAMRLHNDVPQGLSSAIFTLNVRYAERFASPTGSDCGIANVNIGTSGAEIGGAFGGEKETGGGRESGSDAWKVYMRRQTTTVNYGNELPLAQGIKFGE